MIQHIVGGIVAFVAFTALVTFKIATLGTPSPATGEPFRRAVQRLWTDFTRRMRLVVVSAWYWAAAGAWTAYLIASALFAP